MPFQQFSPNSSNEKKTIQAQLSSIVQKWEQAFHNIAAHWIQNCVDQLLQTTDSFTFDRLLNSFVENEQIVLKSLKNIEKIYLLPATRNKSLTQKKNSFGMSAHYSLSRHKSHSIMNSANKYSYFRFVKMKINQETNFEKTLTKHKTKIASFGKFSHSFLKKKQKTGIYTKKQQKTQIAQSVNNRISESSEKKLLQFLNKSPEINNFRLCDDKIDTLREEMSEKLNRIFSVLQKKEENKHSSLKVTEKEKQKCLNTQKSSFDSEYSIKVTYVDRVSEQVPEKKDDLKRSQKNINPLIKDERRKIRRNDKRQSLKQNILEEQRTADIQQQKIFLQLQSKKKEEKQLKSKEAIDRKVKSFEEFISITKKIKLPITNTLLSIFNHKYLEICSAENIDPVMIVDKQNLEPVSSNSKETLKGILKNLELFIKQCPEQKKKKREKYVVKCMNCVDELIFSVQANDEKEIFTRITNLINSLC